MYGSSSSICTLVLRPVKIYYYAKVSFNTNLELQVQNLVIAVVSWFSQHPDYSVVGKPVEVWCNSIYESTGLLKFFPLNFIIGRCAHTVSVISDECVRLIIPLAE